MPVSHSTPVPSCCFPSHSPATPSRILCYVSPCNAMPYANTSVRVRLQHDGQHRSPEPGGDGHGRPPRGSGEAIRGPPACGNIGYPYLAGEPTSLYREHPQHNKCCSCGGSSTPAAPLTYARRYSSLPGLQRRSAPPTARRSVCCVLSPRLWCVANLLFPSFLARAWLFPPANIIGADVRRPWYSLDRISFGAALLFCKRQCFACDQDCLVDRELSQVNISLLGAST